MASTETAKLKSKAKASLTLLLVAVISITTATYAWFTLSNSTSVQNMEVRVGTGAKLEVCTTEGGTYSAFLDNAAINAAMKTGGGWNFDYPAGLDDIRLWPLSSGDGVNLYTKTANDNAGTATDGKKGYYLELPLWFRASTDMNVYLNKDNFSADDNTGTMVTATKGKGQTGAAGKTNEAMRLSVTPSDKAVGDVFIYEPVKTGVTPLSGQAKAGNPTTPNTEQHTFAVLGTNAGLKNGADTTPKLFTLAKGVAKQVTLRIWIEGEDPQCINNATTNIEAEYLMVRLRFCGADDAGNYIEADKE